MVSPMSNNRKTMHLTIPTKDKNTLNFPRDKEAVKDLISVFKEVHNSNKIPKNSKPMLMKMISEMEKSDVDEQAFEKLLLTDKPRDPTSQRNLNPKEFKSRCVLIKAYIDKLCEFSKFPPKILPLTLRSALCLFLQQLGGDVPRVTDLVEKLYKIQDKDSFDNLCKKEPLLQQDQLAKFIKNDDSISEKEEIANIVTLVDSKIEKKANTIARILIMLFRSLECLRDSDIWKKMDEKSQSVVNALNLGITQHYLTKSSQLKNQCDRLLVYSKNETLASDDGFSVVTKEKSVSEVTELTADIFRMVNDGIRIFVNEADQAVVVLEKVNRDIEQRKRDI